MTVIDHDPSGWFLVRDGMRLLLDVNCSHSAVSYPFLMELNADETQAHATGGHDFLARLAEKIQDSGPGVLGNNSPFRDRNLPAADHMRVDAVTIAWVKRKSCAYDWIKLVSRRGQTVSSPSQVELESALMELFASPLDDEHPDAWIECGSEGGALHTMNVFQSGKVIYVRYCDADMSSEEDKKQFHVGSVADAMRLWNAVIEGRHHAL